MQRCFLAIEPRTHRLNLIQQTLNVGKVHCYKFISCVKPHTRHSHNHTLPNIRSISTQTTELLREISLGPRQQPKHLSKPQQTWTCTAHRAARPRPRLPVRPLRLDSGNGLTGQVRARRPACGSSGSRAPCARHARRYRNRARAGRRFLGGDGCEISSRLGPRERVRPRFRRGVRDRPKETKVQS